MRPVAKSMLSQFPRDIIHLIFDYLRVEDIFSVMRAVGTGARPGWILAYEISQADITRILRECRVASGLPP